jgi:hypothetical protein
MTPPVEFHVRGYERWVSELLPVPGADRVRDHTSPDILNELDAELDWRLRSVIDAGPNAIDARLRELQDESDVERLLEANASSLILVGLAASLITRKRRWLLLSGGVAGFLLQHAVQGWCPPLALFRRMGVRTRHEIETERLALRAARGDLTRWSSNGLT